jgi:hypothetical protein
MSGNSSHRNTGYRPDGPLNGIIVDLDPTNGQEGTESIPVFGDIGERFAKRRFARDAGAIMHQPGPNVCNQCR